MRIKTLWSSYKRTELREVEIIIGKHKWITENYLNWPTIGMEKERQTNLIGKKPPLQTEPNNHHYRHDTMKWSKRNKTSITFVSPMAGESRSKCLHRRPTVKSALSRVGRFCFSAGQSLFALWSIISLNKTPVSNCFMIKISLRDELKYV